MKTTVFIDTNILIDFLAQRAEFVAAATVMDMAKKGRIDVYITNLTLANTVYILRKQLDSQQATDTIRQLYSFLKIAPSTANETSFAINTPNPDFEDALQYASAMAVKADFILTRNEKHFQFATMPVMTAAQFLATIDL